MNVPSLSRRAAALVLVFGFLLISGQLARAIFVYANHAILFRQPTKDLALAITHGTRFDLASALMLNSPLLLLLILPLPRRRLLSVARLGCFLVINIPFFWINVLDAEYSRFTGKRSGRELLAFKGDALDQAAQLAGQYWSYFVFCILASAVYVVVAFSVEALLHKETRSKFSWPREALFFLGCSACAGIGIRGGLQRKPLTTTHAYLFESPVLNLLSLNSALVVIKGSSKAGVNSVAYFPTLSEAHDVWLAPDEDIGTASRLIPSQEAAYTLKGTPAPLNVVVILVESLGREYMGSGNPWPGHTPFLDNLAQDGLLFTNGFSNGRRSIDAPWSVFAGIPELMDEPYVTSAYKGNTIAAVPRTLRDAGYSTLFLHGGKNGSMYFDIFARLTGFARYFGMSEYPSDKRSKDYDGTWGIFDGPFLQESVAQLDVLSEPFLGSVFTLSSHNPYTLPKGKEDAYSEGATVPMHKVIRYADDSLREFFAAARTRPWFARTLFILTGDHTSTSTRESYQNDLGFNRVPILLYSPALTFHPKLAARIAQHTDIPCTIFDLTGMKAVPATPFCHSLVDPDFPGQVLLRSGEVYNFVTPRYWTRSLPDGKMSVFLPNETGGFTVPDTPESRAAAADIPASVRTVLSQKTSAGIQLFSNGLNDNALYMRSGKSAP